ncbi:MAG TPA: tetratricopeptide repeat protein [Tenuifilaceae bacterium]|nr:tetratricopeptide repeat protein [Tenuifilaceae bacterium]HPE19654.1 tetratricopeptide repeat protein [Tenuifilaceae bacterium]
MNYRKYSHVILVTLFISSFGFTISLAQTKTDSLRNLLPESSKAEKAKILNDIATEYDNQLSSMDDGEAREQTLLELDGTSTLALESAKKLNDNLQLAKAYRVRAKYYYHTGNYEEMLKHQSQSLEYYKNAGDISLYLEVLGSIGDLQSTIDPDFAIETYSNVFNVDQQNITSDDQIDSYFKIIFALGINYYFQGSYNHSLETFTALYEKSMYHNDSLWISKSLNALGIAAYTGGDYNKALEYYMESLKLRELLGDKEQIASAMVNIGNVHKDIRSYSTAKEYYNKALEIFNTLDDKKNMANCYNNIGIIHELSENLDEAEAFYTEALKIREQLKDSMALITSYINLGSLLKKNKEFKRASTSYRKALSLAQRKGDRKHVALISNNIGDVLYEQKQYQSALPFFFRSLDIAKEIGLKEIVSLNYRSLSNAYDSLGNKSEALQYFRLFFEVREELINEGNQKAIAEMQTKYDTEKKEQQIVLMNKDMELRDAVIKRDRYVKISMGVGIGFVLIFLVFVYIQLQEKKKKNVLLASQKQEIECQRDLLAKQKQEITDSIRYAHRIQRAILPPEQLPEDIMPEHFVLFKPRDIVSGDFYWIASQNNKTYIVAADCTGHGVPGAFMSMLGVAFLNEIVLYHKNTESDVILQELRKLVKTTLAQSRNSEETKDGMDISFCIINWVQNTIQYSGAYNPLYYFRNGEFNEIKADKMPIGAYMKDHLPFTKHEFKIEPGDTFYIFSDGFVDQFGGNDGRKFMTKNFKRLLGSIQSKPMSEQMEVLDETLLEWRGEHEQIDDICVIGFRFNEEHLQNHSNLLS